MQQVMEYAMNKNWPLVVEKSVYFIKETLESKIFKILAISDTSPHKSQLSRYLNTTTYKAK